MRNLDQFREESYLEVQQKHRDGVRNNYSISLYSKSKLSSVFVVSFFHLISSINNNINFNTQKETHCNSRTFYIYTFFIWLYHFILHKIVNLFFVSICMNDRERARGEQTKDRTNEKRKYREADLIHLFNIRTSNIIRTQDVKNIIFIKPLKVQNTVEKRKKLRTH